MKLRFVLAASVLLAGNLEAAPAISTGADGIGNAASYTYQGLPGGAIAQGALFVIKGKEMGPTTIQIGSYPLPTALAGTSLSVTVNGTTVKPFIYYTLAGQISGIMPSNTPVGTGTLSVTYNGATSPAVPITIAPNSFGIFTQNQGGSGPGIFTNVSYALNTYTAAAKAGDATIIWGTGLGAASGGDESAGTAKLNTVAAGVKVFVGGVAASVIGYARSSYAGLDQIAFTIPANVTGCNVPVAVQTGNVVSNYATMAIAASGTTCSDPAGTGNGLTPAQLLQLQQQGTVSIGNVNLGRTATSLALPAPFPSSTTTFDSGSASFQKFSFTQYVQSATGFNATVFGACTVFTFSGQSMVAANPVVPIDLDAGTAITVSGPGGTKTLTKQSVGGYSATLGSSIGSPALYLAAGTYTVTGPGGKDVGPFSTTLTVPTPLTWTNSAAIDTVVRASGQLITWTGGDANSLVEIIGFGFTGSGNTQVGSEFVCTAKATDLQFTIPSAVLLTLAPTGPGGILEGQVGYLGVGTASLSKQFTATGIDIGTITNSSLSVKTVTYQ